MIQAKEVNTLEQAIRFRIDLAKKQIERMQRKLNEGDMDIERNILEGYIMGLRHELSTLEDMLVVWEHLNKKEGLA